MAILHGSWLLHEQRFLVWGKTWRRLDESDFPPLVPPPNYPYGLSQAELSDLLRPYTQSAQRPGADDAVTVALPAHLFELATTQAKRAGRGGRRKTASPPAKANGTKTAEWRSQVVALPTRQIDTTLMPLLSSADPDAASENGNDNRTDDAESSGTRLFPWAITGITLSTDAAYDFLKSLPLGDRDLSWIGPDLRFWSHLTRWAMDLMARAKFLPSVEQVANGAIARWHPLLDSAVDQGRLRHFAQHMPQVCRFYQQIPSQKANAAYSQLNCPPSASDLIADFLSAVVDQQVRAVAHDQPFPSSSPLGNELPLRDWLQSLGAEPASFTANFMATLRLKDALTTWTAPLQNVEVGQTAAFRAGFWLTPPPQGQLEWMLAYGLQATDDSGFWVDAATIWQHPVDNLVLGDRVVDSPQEALLAGLGRAARLYPLIAASLEQQQPGGCQLDPVQAYEFIKTVAWKLQDSGFGVEMPPSLVEQTDSWGDRLGLSVRAEAPSRRQRKSLGLKSLLNFRWELTIGGETLSKAEFERLVALKTPLVEINGKWIELRPQDVKAAQEFFSSRKQQTNLSIEDALRISTGDAQTIEKLPVVSFEAAGALDELITTLTTGNQTLEPLEEPTGFAGNLRPYQARGVSWLAFLEQWGLGACLADDMGLGKTIQL
ncbi:MAG: SNF2 helicase-associated domain-containing protein, partial [Cyanobacteria bacterium P01_C01_bin.73]